MQSVITLFSYIRGITIKDVRDIIKYNTSRCKYKF